MQPSRRLQELIADKGITQKLAAERVGITPVHLSRLLAGTQHPRVALAKKLAALVDNAVQWHELVSGEFAKTQKAPRRARAA